MRNLSPESSAFSHWRDIALVIVVIAATEGFCDYYNVAETLHRLTRPYEHLQFDELPVVALVAALALAWFAWRRYREARRELRRRQATEASLAAALNENRRLAWHYIDAQEKERRSLARELHDELGQYLNAIKLDAVALNTTPAETATHKRAGNILDSIDHMHRSVQGLIRRFRPVGLDELGLAAALENNVSHWRRYLSDTQLELRMDGNVDGCSEAVNLALYRLVQEGLTNISRHAQAHRVFIHLERVGAADGTADSIQLTIHDDGVGANPNLANSGLGLIGMRERVELLSGHFEKDSAPGKGFTLNARLPVSPQTMP